MNVDFLCAPPVDVHDFCSGDFSDWNLSVVVTHSDDPHGKGEVIEPHAVEPNARRFMVPGRTNVQVKIENRSLDKIVEFQPVWVDESGDEYREDPVKLAPLFTQGGYGVQELPWVPHDYSNDETSWLLKDLDGRHVLRLYFTSEQ